MGQSNVIAGALALAFLMFITLRGELPKYLNLFKYKKHVAATSNKGSGDSPSFSFGDLDTMFNSALSKAGDELKQYGVEMLKGGGFSFGDMPGGA